MFKIIFRGMAIGVTEIVPGVSGSTVAMILGIYERLLYSLSILTTNKRKEAIPFLITLGFGMVIGFASALFIINSIDYFHSHITDVKPLSSNSIVAVLPSLIQASNSCKVSLLLISICMIRTTGIVMAIINASIANTVNSF